MRGGGGLYTSLMSLIMPHYDEKHRHYHNWHHINQTFIYAGDQDLSNAQTLAILYHDAVYVPGYTGNEDASAELLRVHYAEFKDRFLACTPEDVERAAAIILMTKNHQGDALDADLVLDCDLAGLGDTWEVYQKNSQDIRKEFWRYTDEQFKQGRIAFLQGMIYRLENAGLYTHEQFDVFEGRALDNMNRELLALQNG